MELTMEEISEYAPFDFVLHDGSHIKHEVRSDIEKILPFMKKNSILLVHDTCSMNYQDELLQGSYEAFENIGIEYEEVTLPYSYGLTIFKITDERMKECVTPTWYKGQ